MGVLENEFFEVLFMYFSGSMAQFPKMTGGMCPSHYRQSSLFNCCGETQPLLWALALPAVGSTGGSCSIPAAPVLSCCSPRCVTVPSLDPSFIRYCCSGHCASCAAPSPDNSSHTGVLAWQEEAVALQAHRETPFLTCALFCIYSVY